MEISMSDVSKVFDNGIKALDGINLEIKNGIFGLLGQNGAGKTTFMRVLTTIYDVSGGIVKMDGISYNKKSYPEIKKKIGYLPQELGMYPNLSVRESLEYIGALSDIPSDILKKRIDDLLEMTNMEKYQKRKNRQLSGGMKRRVGLIQAMLTTPELLIVDEPTAGVDPEERIKLRKMISDYGKGHTVIFSTHVVEDLVSMSNRLCVLNKGKAKYIGTVSEMMQIASGHCFTCNIESEEDDILESDDIYVVDKNYEENKKNVKFISRNKPDLKCIPVSPNLEDAYIYINHFM